MSLRVPEDAKVLIVDDERPNVALLEQILARSGYGQVVSTTDSREALDLFRAERPDIVLLDLHMPELDGFELIRRLRREIPTDDFVPLVVLTADGSPEVKKEALSGGANDFLTKPFNYHEALLRIRNLLTTRRLHGDLKRQNELLDERVRERTRELEEARVEVLERLARAAEFRDDDTGHHTRRVGELSARLARRLGLAPRAVELLRLAAPLHDVGKIGVPDAILLKPGKLTDREWEVMKRHTVIGAELLAGSSSALLQLAERIARWHHERWDGTGYPDRLVGEEAPLEARIVAVVDVFDALRSPRPYRAAWPVEQVVEEIRSERGRHFDPDVVDAFLEMVAPGRVTVKELGALEKTPSSERAMHVA